MMYELLQWLDSFSRHPLVLAFVSISIGTWYLGRLNYNRSRRDAIRDKALGFVEQIGKSLNKPLPNLFFYLKAQKQPEDDQLFKDVHELFTLRLSVRVQSEAYLNSAEFSRTYDELVAEISRIERALAKNESAHQELLQRAEQVWSRSHRLLTDALAAALNRK